MPDVSPSACTSGHSTPLPARCQSPRCSFSPRVAEVRFSLLHLPRRWLGRLAWAALLVYFVCGLGFLILRHGVLPKVPAYRGEVAAMLSRSLGLPVDIASLSADWQGLHPRLNLGGVTIRDSAGQAALSLDRVDAELGFVEPDKGDIAVGRHRFRRAEQPAGVGRQDALFPGDQPDLLFALDADDAVVNLTRQKAQRKAHDAGRMCTKPLNREMRLARVGRPEHGRDRVTRALAHCLQIATTRGLGKG